MLNKKETPKSFKQWWDTWRPVVYVCTAATIICLLALAQQYDKSQQKKLPSSAGCKAANDSLPQNVFWPWRDKEY
ncbi:MAG: hypothetical protein J6Y07_01810 [Alphaproteobacteria bacterium]|nr:hypothetical protein [Alphaproteobacteria bacterium]